MTAFQHVAATYGLDWVSRHEYWEWLCRRRSYRFVVRIAEQLAPDQLLYGYELPIHKGSTIALQDKDRSRQLTLEEAFVHRNVRRRID